MGLKVRMLLAHTKVTSNAERQKDAWVCAKGGLRVLKDLAKTC